MEINTQQNRLYFGQIYTTAAADKLLKKADKAVKASREVTFVDVNIPDGHRIPLWSVLSEHIKKRQGDNPNNIVIDLLEDGKKLLSVKTCDAKGFVHKKWVVNPMPVIGTYSDLFPEAKLVSSGKSFSQNTYGRSAFFDVIDSAEVDVDMLKLEESLNSRPKHISIRELPRVKRENKTNGKILRNLLKRQEKLNVPHVQRPFLKLKDMVLGLLNSNADAIEGKAQPKVKNKLPRRLKKELKKNNSEIN